MHDNQAGAVTHLTAHAQAIHAARDALQAAISDGVAAGLLVLADTAIEYSGTGSQTPILTIRVAQPL